VQFAAIPGPALQLQRGVDSQRTVRIDHNTRPPIWLEQRAGYFEIVVADGETQEGIRAPAICGQRLTDTRVLVDGRNAGARNYCTARIRYCTGNASAHTGLRARDEQKKERQNELHRKAR